MLNKLKQLLKKKEKKKEIYLDPKSREYFDRWWATFFPYSNDRSYESYLDWKESWWNTWGK